MLIAGFLILLLIGFWVVGARNRLMRLRQDVAGALPPLALQLRKRHVLARHWSQSLHRRDADAAALAPSIELVLVAESEAAGALNAVQTRPIGTPDQMRRLAAAEEALAAALATLTETLQTQSAKDAAPGDDLRQRLEQLHPPLDYARQAYNAAVQTHNAALRVFPTTLVASTLRLQPAVLLPRLSKAG
ncbi:MAG: LemA family protein [Burkholderiales bacterium]